MPPVPDASTAVIAAQHASTADRARRKVQVMVRAAVAVASDARAHVVVDAYTWESRE